MSFVSLYVGLIFYRMLDKGTAKRCNDASDVDRSRHGQAFQRNRSLTRDHHAQDELYGLFVRFQNPSEDSSTGETRHSD